MLAVFCKATLPRNPPDRHALFAFSLALPAALVFSLSPFAAQAAAQRSLEEIKKEAALGFDSPIYKEAEKAGFASHNFEDEEAAATISKLVKKYPDRIWLRQLQVQNINLKDGPRKALPAMEETLKIAETAGADTKDLNFWLEATYQVVGDWKRQSQLLEKMIKRFPHSKVEILQHMVRAYRGCGDRIKYQDALAQLRLAEKNAPQISALLALKPTGKDHLPSGFAYKALQQSLFFPRFTANSDGHSIVLDTGTMRFLIVPPNYNLVTFINPETKNYFKTTQQGVLSHFYCSSNLQPVYSKVTEVDRLNIAGVACVQYMCQVPDENRFDLITVAKDTFIDPQLALANAKMGNLPPNYFMVLAMSRVVGGYPEPILHTYRLTKEKFDGKVITEVAQFHQAKDMNSLMYSEHGELRKEDVDDSMRTR